MLQVKIFKRLEFRYTELEEEVNRWIREHEIDVVDIRVQIAPQSPGQFTGHAEFVESDVICYVVYRT